MDLFGLVDVEHPRRPVTPWSPAGVKHLPFGDAVFTLLSPPSSVPSGTKSSRRGGRGRGGRVRRTCLASGPGSRCSSRIFPNGGRTWSFPSSEPREGTFIFRVSLGKVWRLIAMPADATLDDLVSWILRLD